MKVKIIGGYHRGQQLDVQDNILVVSLPEGFEAMFSLDNAAPTVRTYTVRRYKLYKKYCYLNDEIVGYFIPEDWVHHEVERMLMDQICAN